MTLFQLATITQQQYVEVNSGARPLNLDMEISCQK